MHIFAQPSDSNQESWRDAIAKYQHSNLRRSVWQIINSFGPYFILSYLMYRSLDVSYWITLAHALLAAGFQVRTFIIFHDCCHGSFFKSQRANDIVGIVKWFSGNIGFHHIHHLNPCIPNYTLSECQKEVPIFWSVKPITLLSSMRSLALRLWDEERRVPVGFDYLKTAERST